MKSALKSKTLWFNILTAIVVGATYIFGYQPDKVVEQNVASVVTNPLFILAVNFVLRLVTHQGIVLPYNE